VKVQEVEEKINTRIAGLEDQETRLHEWLECIRQVGDIAEKMGYNRSKSQGEEGSLMKAFEEMVEQSGVDDTQLLTAGSFVETMDEDVADKQPEPVESGEAHHDREQEADSVKVDAVPDESEEEPEEIHNLPDDGILDQLRRALSSPIDKVEEEADSAAVNAVQERSEQPAEIRGLPDEGSLDQLRESLNRPKDEKKTKKRFGGFMSSFFAAEED